jgi:hypothetical protein
VRNQSSSMTNATITTQYTCDFVDPKQAVSFYLMDLINSTLVPFCIMFISSLILGTFIFKSRLKMLNLSLERDRVNLKRNIRFCLTILFLNFFFFVLNLPVALGNVLSIISSEPMIYHLFIYIFYFSYSVNFYILAVFNRIFKNELVALFRDLSCIKKVFGAYTNTSSSNGGVASTH